MQDNNLITLDLRLDICNLGLGIFYLCFFPLKTGIFLYAMVFGTSVFGQEILAYGQG